MCVHGDIKQTVTHAKYEQADNTCQVAGQVQQCTNRYSCHKASTSADSMSPKAANKSARPKNRKECAHSRREHRQRHFTLTQAMQMLESRNMNAPCCKGQSIQEKVGTGCPVC